jgi:hypothetical protein
MSGNKYKNREKDIKELNDCIKKCNDEIDEHLSIVKLKTMECIKNEKQK